MSTSDQPTQSNQSFSCCEQAVKRICDSLPDAPYQEVILTRLYYHVQTQLNEFFNAELRHHGLNISSWTALMVLYASPENAKYPSELSDAMGFSRTNATRVVDDLVARGWIERQPCADDRRKIRLMLTDAGRAFVHGALPERHQHLRALWADFSDVEKTALEALLRKMLTRLGG